MHTYMSKVQVVQLSPFTAHVCIWADFSCSGLQAMMGARGASDGGSHLEDGEMIGSARIHPPPLAVSDLIIQDILDEICQETTATGELEFEAVSLCRAAIVEAYLEIALVEDLLKRHVTRVICFRY